MVGTFKNFHTPEFSMIINLTTEGKDRPTYGCTEEICFKTFMLMAQENVHSFYSTHLQRYRVSQARNQHSRQQVESLLGFLIDPEDGGDMLLCNVRLSPTTWHYKPEGCTLHSH
jgi:hypothetical protein